VMNINEASFVVLLCILLQLFGDPLVRAHQHGPKIDNWYLSALTNISAKHP
jgi:hypothetical protein